METVMKTATETAMETVMEPAQSFAPASPGLPPSSAGAEPEDGELVARARTDDREAFAQLVDRHKNRVINYLTRLTGSRDRAEDFAQETFLRLYQGLDGYRDEGALVAYLMRIATNLVRSRERRKGRWKVLEPLFRVSGFRGGHGVSGADGTVTRSPQSRALASEEQRQVAAAIASLDMIYRAPLVLREIEDLSYRDIAEALGLSEGTIKSRIHRARALLQEKLAPYWQGGGRHHD